MASCRGEFFWGRQTPWAAACSDIHDIFGYIREVATCVVSDGTVYLHKNSLSVGVMAIVCPKHRFLDRMRSPIMKIASEGPGGVHSPGTRQRLRR